MARKSGLFGWVLEEAQERLGYSVAPTSRLNALEEAAGDARTLRSELRRLAYTTLNALPYRDRELSIESRRRLVQQTRIVWQKDPMAGQATDLLNDFVLGKGIPKPKAKDPEVQKVIDEFWDDPDNQRTITSPAAQIAFNTDLTLQSNLFFLVFDDGDDGKVKVSFLEHDSVRNAVRDRQDRFCPLWFLADHVEEDWDWSTHAPRAVSQAGAVRSTQVPGQTIVPAQQVQGPQRTANVLYYEHIVNYEARLEASRRSPRVEEPIRPPSDDLIGAGKVFHLSENRLTEMIFGHPRMDRTLRWYSAYNSFMEARVDMMRAAAALVMKRKTDGSPSQVARQTLQTLSRVSDASVDVDRLDVPSGPKPASVLNENTGVTHEAFKLPSGAAEAVQDAGQLRAQVSAGTGFPPTYFGDLSSGNISTSTSLELPVLKRCESRSELVESALRFLVDRAIKRKVEVGLLSEKLTAEEIAAKRAADGKTDEANPDVPPAEAPAGVFGPQGGRPALSLVQSYEDQEEDEEATARDLSYELTMPNPLRRALGDIVAAVIQVAQGFDPNNTNVELSRVLLLIALQELEVQDAAEMVEKIFPAGYQDPMLAQAQPAPEQPAPAFGPFGPQPGNVGADGDRHPADNPYGVPMRGRTPEQQPLQQARVLRRRDGSVIELEEAAWWRPDDERRMVADRIGQTGEQWDAQVGDLVEKALASLNGSH